MRLPTLLLLLGSWLSPTPAMSAEAVFAGGCFWCMESDYEKLRGVQEVISGYTGGTEPNPSYKQVSSGSSSHVEAVQVRYDPAQISYQQLLDYFWINVDPTQDDRQFCDSGRHYRPAIFVKGAAQRSAAEASMAQIEQAGTVSPIKVTIETASRFWPAEDYHQDYYRKNPLRYNYYRYSCGRDARLEQLWGEDRKQPFQALLTNQD